MPNNENASTARSVVGKVVSDKMNKTIVVRVEIMKKDPKYGKFVRKSSKLHAHDENEIAKIGNTVKIQESRPISKTKSWKLLEVIS